MLLVFHLETELVLEDVAHGLDALHRDGDVLDTLDLHGKLLARRSGRLLDAPSNS
jgi:hypothetical protein